MIEFILLYDFENLENVELIKSVLGIFDNLIKDLIAFLKFVPILQLSNVIFLLEVTYLIAIPKR
jgi:hypothetical protein